jgi:hypothetical protein
MRYLRPFFAMPKRDGCFTNFLCIAQQALAINATYLAQPAIPAGTTPEAWFQRLFVEEPENYALRPYDQEQWDMMFFIQGQAEMFLVDERAGMPRRKMRFIIEGAQE